MEAIDREFAELAWQEYYQELLADDEALRLWEESQTKEIEWQAELEMMIEQGLEIPF